MIYYAQYARRRDHICLGLSGLVELHSFQLDISCDCPQFASLPKAGPLKPQKRCECASIFQRNIPAILCLVFVVVLVFVFLISVGKARVSSITVLPLLLLPYVTLLFLDHHYGEDAGDALSTVLARAGALEFASSGAFTGLVAAVELDGFPAIEALALVEEDVAGVAFGEG